jgi:GT2 family glycosyltransferase
LQLSVVIVNYNVKYFLEKALHSVFQSQTPFDFEVFVVDNHSVDGSNEMVLNQFPQVKLIANKVNVGFSAANNMAIQQAKGKYILLLNPDTIIKEDTIAKVVDFMEKHSDAGGLGVKMMDGNGHFLPESKRGFPTPFVAFCKMSGLSKLFPKSEKFNRYHLGHLDKNANHSVEVLSGAFMLLRKSVLDSIGLLDEAYFMYGEDIDLSYRIIQSGYKNYYFSETEIIHFKGESTKKGSFNYVKMFYNAMIIFSKKHFTGSAAKYLIFLLSLAIYLRASIALFRRFFEKISWPFLDALLIFSAMFGIKEIWESFVKEGIIYPTSYLLINLPLYIATWLLSFYFRGGYERPVRLKPIVPGIAIGTVVILAIYALLPLHLRSSRAMILLGALAAVLLLTLSRLAVFSAKGKLKNLLQLKNKVLIIASPEESKRISDLIIKADIGKEFIGIAHHTNAQSAENYLGTIADVEEIVKVHQINEIIFSLKDMSNNEVMHIMSVLGGKVEYKIISEGSNVIIGSNSKNTSGELYTLDINFHLNQPQYKRTKRLTDIVLSFFFLITAPIVVWLVQHKTGFIKNAFKVLWGKKTWVGYSKVNEKDLPKIKPAVLPVISEKFDDSVQRNANVMYAKNYHWSSDVVFVFQHFRLLGN